MMVIIISAIVLPFIFFMNYFHIHSTLVVYQSSITFVFCTNQWITNKWTLQTKSIIVTENCDGIGVRHNLWRKLWRRFNGCDGLTVNSKLWWNIWKLWQKSWSQLKNCQNLWRIRHNPPQNWAIFFSDICLPTLASSLLHLPLLTPEP